MLHYDYNVRQSKDSLTLTPWAERGFINVKMVNIVKTFLFIKHNFVLFATQSSDKRAMFLSMLQYQIDAADIKATLTVFLCLDII